MTNEDKLEAQAAIDEAADTLRDQLNRAVALLREEFDDGPHRYCGGKCWGCRRSAFLAEVS